MEQFAAIRRDHRVDGLSIRALDAEALYSCWTIRRFNIDDIVLDRAVEQGNPPDAPQLAPAVARVKKRTGRAPHTVTADRGYGEAKVEQQLTDLGVNNVVIPRKGKPSQARRVEERRKAFPRIVKWRTGSEGRISYLKRGYGLDPTRIDGTGGARIWTGHGILAHNLVKISALAA